MSKEFVKNQIKASVGVLIQKVAVEAVRRMNEAGNFIGLSNLKGNESEALGEALGELLVEQVLFAMNHAGFDADEFHVEFMEVLRKTVQKEIKARKPAYRIRKSSRR